jgi:hypothetical protein
MYSRFIRKHRSDSRNLSGERERGKENLMHEWRTFTRAKWLNVVNTERATSSSCNASKEKGLRNFASKERPSSTSIEASWSTTFPVLRNLDRNSPLRAAPIAPLVMPMTDYGKLDIRESARNLSHT